MIVPDGSNRIDIRTVVRTDVHATGREDLEVPVRGFVVLLEALGGEEGEGRALVARRKDTEVTGDFL